jgi:hypothetical protein
VGGLPVELDVNRPALFATPRQWPAVRIAESQGSGLGDVQDPPGYRAAPALVGRRDMDDVGIVDLVSSLVERLVRLG